MMKAFGISVAFLTISLLAHRVGAAEPTSRHANNPPEMEAKDLKGLIAAKGEKVIVKGEVSMTLSAQPDEIKIQFKHANGGFSALIEKKDVKAFDEAFGGDVRNAVEDKTIRVTGTIEVVKPYPQADPVPQMKLTKPEQLQIVKD